MEIVLKKTFLLSLLFVFVFSAALGVYGFTRDGVDLASTIESLERRVFDMQLSLRNVSTGDLFKRMSGMSRSEQESTAKNFGAAFRPSAAFGIDYLNVLVSSYKSGKQTVSSSPTLVSQSAFLDIQALGVTVSKDRAILTVSVGGSVQLWLWKKENGAWTTKDVPIGYGIEGAEISMNSVSFVMYPITEPTVKRKYEFSFGAVPSQFNSPR